MISDAFIDGRDESVVGWHFVVFGLVQMKLEEPDGKKNSWLDSEPQLFHSDKKNCKVSFSYADSDRTCHGKQIVQSAIDQSLMVGQSKSLLQKSLSEKVHIVKRSVKYSKTRK